MIINVDVQLTWADDGKLHSYLQWLTDIQRFLSENYTYQTKQMSLILK